MNDPIPGLGLRLEVPEIRRNAVVADGFEKPTASVLVSAKRRLRWEMTLGHATPCAHVSVALTQFGASVRVRTLRPLLDFWCPNARQLVKAQRPDDPAKRRCAGIDLDELFGKLFGKLHLDQIARLGRRESYCQLCLLGASSFRFEVPERASR